MGDPGDRGGVELDELEVGEGGAGRAGEQEAGAERARRVGGAAPERGGAAGGEDDGAGPEGAAVVGVEAGDASSGLGREPRRRAAGDAEPCRAAALEHLDPRVLRDGRAELAEDAAAGRAPARVGDAAARVPALEAQREVAVAVGVEADAEALEVAEAPGRLLGEDARGGGADDAAARVDRVGEVELRRVVLGQRRGEPALRPVGGGLGERAGGDQGDVGALARGAERCVETGRPGAHDDEVGPLHGKSLRYPRAPDRLAAPRALARPRGAPPSRAPAADRRPRGRDGAARLVRLRRRAAGRRDARAAAGRAPGLAHRLHRGAVRGRRRAHRHGHRRDGGDLRGGGAVGGRVGGAGGRAALGRGGERVRRHAATRAPRRAAARHGLLLLRQRGGGGAARPGRVRRRAGADRGLGRPPRQRDERDLPLRSQRPVRLDPRVAAVSGDRAGVRPRARRRRGLHGQPAGAGRLGRRDVPLAGRPRRGAVDREPGSRGWCWCRRASTPIPWTRSPRAA